MTNDPAELGRQFLAEIEQQPGGLARELERRAGKRRLQQAARDLHKREGPDAVRAAVAEIYAELGIVGRAGRPPEPLPYGMVKVAARCFEAMADGHKLPSLGQLQRLAARHDLRISKPGIRKWMEGDRWPELLSLAWAERMSAAITQDDAQ